MKDKIIDNVKFILGGLTIIAVVVLKNKLGIAAIVGGVGLALVGICNVLLKNRMGYLYTCLGVSLCSTMIIYKLNILDKPDSITFFFCLAMAILTVIVAIFDKVTELEHKKKHSMEVEAEVVDLVKNPNTKREYYQPVYEYFVNDESYVVGYPEYLEKGIPNIGEKIKLYINPDEVTDVFFEKTTKNKLYMLALELFFFIASVIILITLFI